MYEVNATPATPKRDGFLIPLSIFGFHVLMLCHIMITVNYPYVYGKLRPLLASTINKSQPGEQPQL